MGVYRPLLTPAIPQVLTSDPLLIDPTQPHPTLGYLTPMCAPAAPPPIPTCDELTARDAGGECQVPTLTPVLADLRLTVSVDAPESPTLPPTFIEAPWQNVYLDMVPVRSVRMTITLENNADESIRQADIPDTLVLRLTHSNDFVPDNTNGGNPFRGEFSTSYVTWSLQALIGFPDYQLTPGETITRQVDGNRASSGTSYFRVQIDDQNPGLPDANVGVKFFRVSVPITKIDFAPLRAAMFWGIFYETSEDEYFSGNVNDQVNEFYTQQNINPAIPARFFINEPYCVYPPSPLYGNAAPFEQLGSESGWNANILAISHCNRRRIDNYTVRSDEGQPPSYCANVQQRLDCIDHRQFYAQSIINNLIRRERQNSTNLAPAYFFENNWGTSFQDGTSTVWTNTQICTNEDGTSSLPSNYLTYAEALEYSLTTKDYVPALNWLDAYLNCQRSNISTDPNDTDRRVYIENAYQNIMREVDLALANITFDPTGGVTTTIQANSGIDTASQFVHLVTDIDGDSGVNGSGCDTQASSREFDAVYLQHISVLRGYNPTLRTILRPAIRAELYKASANSEYVFSCYSFVSFSFQIPTTPQVR